MAMCTDLAEEGDGMTLGLRKVFEGEREEGRKEGRQELLMEKILHLHRKGYGKAEILDLLETDADAYARAVKSGEDTD